MVVRMRHTRGQTANRRSHHAIKMNQFSICPNCNARIYPHIACDVCGMYKGKIVRKVKAKSVK